MHVQELFKLFHIVLMVFKRKLELVIFFYYILFFRLGDRKLFIIWAIVFLFTHIYECLYRYIMTGKYKMTSTTIEIFVLIIVGSNRIILSSDLVVSSDNTIVGPFILDDVRLSIKNNLQFLHVSKRNFWRFQSGDHRNFIVGQKTQWTKDKKANNNPQNSTRLLQIEQHKPH